MKRNQSRILSMMLSFVLAFSLFGIPGSAVAAELDAGSESSEQSVPSSDEGSSGEDEFAAVPSFDPEALFAEEEDPALQEEINSGVFWNIFVSIIDARGYVDRVATPTSSYVVTLSGDNGGEMPSAKDLTQTGNNEYQATYLFSQLDGTEYTIKVTDPADPFVTYTQDITRPSDGRDFEVQLYAGKLGDQGDGLVEKKSGSIVYGDFNGDSTVDDKDVSKLLDAIEKKSDQQYDLRLDGDQQSSLVDLQILAEQKGNDCPTSDNHAASRLDVDPDSPFDPDANVVISSGQVVTDDKVLDTAGVTPITLEGIADLVNNDSDTRAFVMGSSSGEPISEINPVSVELRNLQDFLTTDKVTSEGDSSVKVENGNVMVSAMRVTSMSEISTITEGHITATYEENGVEHEVVVPFSRELSDAQEFAAMGYVGFTSLTPGFSVMAASADEFTPQSVAATTGSFVSNDGVITVNFGKLIAVKKVTLTFTKARSVGSEDFNLAAISSVEFLNGAEQFVDAPEMNVPTGVEAVSRAGKSFEVSWDRQENVTGYEIHIEAQGAQQVVFVKGTNTPRQTKQITSFVGGKKGKVENNVTYTVKVQSVNQNWRSGWSETHDVTPVATKVPDAPEKITVTGKFRSLGVSWSASEDADTYTIYYRVHGSTELWARATNIENVSHTIVNLADDTDYDIYLTATNDMGTSGPSKTHIGHTQSITAAKLPEYKLVNTKDASGRYLDNIESATLASTGAYIEGDATLDPVGTQSVKSLFDGNSSTYLQVNDWDLGTSYNVGRHGVNVQFKSKQTIGFISFAAAADNVGYSRVAVSYWDDEGKRQMVQNVSIVQRDGGNNRRYSLITLPNGVTTDHLLIGVSRLDGGRGINIAEMRFHGYDSVYKEILDLYEDEAHIKLQSKYDDQGNVVAETAEERTERLKPVMDALKERLNTPDSVSGEDFPMKAMAMSELDYAYQLLEDENKGLGDMVSIHSSIADAYDANKSLGISGLNAWQPLGRSAMGGETIIVYVNAPNTSGSKSRIDLYVGQNIGESSKAPRRVGTFLRGRTVFTIPESAMSTELTEHGGQLYAQYTGSNPNEAWSVRILGGNEIPVLDLYNVTDQAERQSRVNAYMQKLGAHVNNGNLVKVHNDSLSKETGQHKAGTVDIAYGDTTCIANATDIMLDKIMFSIPATQAWAGCGGSADRLLTSLNGYDQMMESFYQHKGLMDATNDAGVSTGAAGTNVAPARHLNVRAMTMFAGAFMYAAGNHIGIGYGSCGLVGGLTPVDDTSVGAKGTGTYAGWGLAHEIGHNINDGRYAYAEVTNNYFAQMARYINNGTTRFKYPTVYKHVTSGAAAHSGNVFTQLAMYWQLMLAYDNHEMSTMYDTWDQLASNRFFARVDSYARNPLSFQGDVRLTFSSEQQNIIRLASAAAGKDLSNFFTAWGFVPDAETKVFLAQFDEETRALQYGDESTAHRQEVNHQNDGRASFAGVDVLDKSNVTTELDGSVVNLSINLPSGINAADVHGFEVARIYYAAGQPQREVIGFVQESNGAYQFADDAGYLGNRCVSYEVCAIDKHLNRSNLITVDQVKLQGNGRLVSDGWTATTNMDTVSVTPGATNGDFDEEGLECEAEHNSALSDIESVFDAGRDYVGKSTSGDPEVVIDMNSVNAVEHITFTPVDQARAIEGYTLEVKNTEAGEWQKISEGTLVYEGGQAQIYFPRTQNGEVMENPDYINTENARFVKLTAKGKAAQEVSLRSIEIFGPSGDDVEMTTVAVEGESQAVPAIGKLTADFVYDQALYDSSNHTDGVIKANSIVFTGAFKGNPAYNSVVLFNEKGEIVGGTDDSGMLKAQQIILAPQPDLGTSFGTTASGRWIYWIENASELYSGMKVRAELYRVDNAFTNEGQRLVADCAAVGVKDADQLDPITFSSDTADLKGQENV